MLDFGRDICGDLANAERREWLVTNGIGGFAMGTIAGTLTRRYHGLLLAALNPPLGRTLLFAKLDETATVNGTDYALFNNRWADGKVEPNGYHHLERFHLEGTVPVWTFALGDALLEKRIWMAQGSNTTYIRYTVVRAQAPVKIYAKALVNHRDYHATTVSEDWDTQIESIADGMKVTAFPEATPLYLFGENAKAWVEEDYFWYEDYLYSIEEYRGQNDVTEDHLYAGTFELTLAAGQSATIVASTEPQPIIDGAMALAAQTAHEQSLLDQAGDIAHTDMRQLVLAADQFMVKRATPTDPHGLSVIAGYPWFSDWGRDTMIALPGLTLATGRGDDAEKILRTFAHFVDQGMIPNRFPDEGETPEYNTVDATLWFFEAIRAYHETTNDLDLVRDLFPILDDIIQWHKKGTRYNIKVDPRDGLLHAGEAGVQLTWMDAKVDDWVVTPRVGKPVEINALWYNALCIMVDFAKLLGDSTTRFQESADKVLANFGKFWQSQHEYCFDVIETPSGNDGALRPNQLFAVSLPHSPLNVVQQKSVVDVCARQLLTSHGMRSLSPTAIDYQGHYGGDRYKRDGAYHQGTVWSWQLGAFVSAYLRVYNDKIGAMALMRPLWQHLGDAGIGSISEIFDGDAPFTPRGCPAQAWGVAELLRVWQLCQE
jgi:predicted glycogen debranching enzyme